jgi:hypothetical protein
MMVEGFFLLCLRATVAQVWAAGAGGGGGGGGGGGARLAAGERTGGAGGGVGMTVSTTLSRVATSDLREVISLRRFRTISIRAAMVSVWRFSSFPKIVPIAVGLKLLE